MKKRRKKNKFPAQIGIKTWYVGAALFEIPQRRGLTWAHVHVVRRSSQDSFRKLVGATPYLTVPFIYFHLFFLFFSPKINFLLSFSDHIIRQFRIKIRSQFTRKLINIYFRTDPKWRFQKSVLLPKIRNLEYRSSPNARRLRGRNRQKGGASSKLRRTITFSHLISRTSSPWGREQQEKLVLNLFPFLCYLCCSL